MHASKRIIVFNVPLEKLADNLSLFDVLTQGSTTTGKNLMTALQTVKMYTTLLSWTMSR